MLDRFGIFKLSFRYLSILCLQFSQLWQSKIRIAILIKNAGIFKSTPIVDITV
jgi:hypothetical protein